MNSTPIPTHDSSDLPPGDADDRIIDALLCTTGDSDRTRHRRIERVLMAVDTQSQSPSGADVMGRIRPLSKLVPAGFVAAAVLLTIWAVWPGQPVETAQVAIVRVAASLQSVDHRRYAVTVLTADGGRLSGTVDVARGDRFVSRFSPAGAPGSRIAVVAGSDGDRYWLVPPIGPVRVSDEPFGPLFPAAPERDEPGAALLSLPRAISALSESHDIEFAETDDPDLMRFITTRKQHGGTESGVNELPILATADVIAQRDSGEIVQAKFMLDQQFVVGNRVIRSITFNLQRDAAAPPPEWYEHQTHHAGQR